MGGTNQHLNVPLVKERCPECAAQNKYECRKHPETARSRPLTSTPDGRCLKHTQSPVVDVPDDAPELEGTRVDVKRKRASTPRIELEAGADG